MSEPLNPNCALCNCCDELTHTPKKYGRYGHDGYDSHSVDFYSGLPLCNQCHDGLRSGEYAAAIVKHEIRCMKQGSAMKMRPPTLREALAWHGCKNPADMLPALAENKALAAA